MATQVTERGRAGRFVGEILGRVIVDPVREGRMQPAAWPAGLAGVVALALGGMGLATVLLLTAPLWRSYSPLTAADGYQALPTWAVIPLLWLMVLAVSLVATAGLHVFWPVQLGLYAIVLAALITATAFAGATTPLAAAPMIVCLVGLLALGIARRRRRYAFVEFAITAGLVTLAVFGGLLIAQFHSMGVYDVRPQTLYAMAVLASEVAFPGLIVAGYSLAQITVSAGAWTVARGATGLAPHWRRWGTIAAVALALGVAAWQVLGHGALDPGALLGAVGVVGISAAVAVGCDAIARRARPGSYVADSPLARPDTLESAWAPYLYPVAFAMMTTVLLGNLLTVATVVQAVFLRHPVDVSGLLAGPLVAPVFRTGMAVVLLGVAVARAARGDRRAPVLLAPLAVVLATSAWAIQADGLLDLRHTDGSLEVVALLACGAVALWLTVRRRWDAGRAAAVLTALVVTALWPLRGVVAAPLEAAVGLLAVVGTLFGLTWRLLTDGEFTRGDTRRLPRATRVLIHVGNVLLGFIAIAYAAVTRSVGGNDPEDFVSMGDTLLGTPLFVASVLVGLAAALRPDGSG